MTETTMPAWISVKEAAKRCDVSASWIYRQISNKTENAPPHFWMGGLLRIPAEGFETWLKERLP
jgi:excisionase family DNA binding protein